jgi:hypothetical protein
MRIKLPSSKKTLFCQYTTDIYNHMINKGLWWQDDVKIIKNIDPNSWVKRINFTDFNFLKKHEKTWSRNSVKTV